MITIIHGDDTVSSRNYLVEQKNRSEIYFAFEGDSLIVTDLIQAVESGTLFNKSKTVFVENFLTKRKPGKQTDAIISYLNKQAQNNTFLWEEKEISQKNLSYFPKALIKDFRFPQSIFVFLDSIKPGNGKNTILLFHKTLENMQIEIIMFMLIRQFRLLLAITDFDLKTNIDEAKRLAPWQKSKLQSQTKLFNLDYLTKIYLKLYKIDHAQKTGELNQPLTGAIDFFLLDI